LIVNSHSLPFLLFSSESLLLLHNFTSHIFLKLHNVILLLLDFVLEVSLKFIHSLNLFSDKLDSLLDIGLGLTDVLLREDGPDKLVDGGAVAHEVELLQHHLVLALLLHQLLLRPEHLRVLRLDLLDLSHVALQSLLDLTLLLQEGLAHTRGDTLY
jgi:hypothetical protein